MAKLKITKTNSVSGQLVDRYTGPEYLSGAYLGGTGGLTSQTGRQINPTVSIGNGSLSGSILRQKGTHKFLVSDGTSKAVATLVSSITGTGQMTILCTKADTTTFYASRITNRWVYDFSGNKYRYHLATATTSNTYRVDAAAGVTGFVQVAYA